MWDAWYAFLRRGFIATRRNGADRRTRNVLMADPKAFKRGKWKISGYSKQEIGVRLYNKEFV